MQLIPNWRQVLVGSWSSRLGFLASMLAGLEVLLPMFSEAIPKGWFAIATVLVSALIPVVRVIQQQALHEGEFIGIDPEDGKR